MTTALQAAGEHEAAADHEELELHDQQTTKIQYVIGPDEDYEIRKNVY